jgi:hypothetical protein
MINRISEICLDCNILILWGSESLKSFLFHEWFLSWFEVHLPIEYIFKLNRILLWLVWILTYRWHWVSLLKQSAKIDVKFFPHFLSNRSFMSLWDFRSMSYWCIGYHTPIYRTIKLTYHLLVLRCWRIQVVFEVQLYHLWHFLLLTVLATLWLIFVLCYHRTSKFCSLRIRRVNLIPLIQDHLSSAPHHIFSTLFLKNISFAQLFCL